MNRTALKKTRIKFELQNQNDEPLEGSFSVFQMVNQDWMCTAGVAVS